jgi:predicted CXXCH cytochrome family protein
MKQPMSTRCASLVLALALACGREEAVKPAASPTGPAQFVSDATCAECHAVQKAAWTGSHHDRAMEVADAKSVLGDFSGADPNFALADGEYRVRAEGADGKRGEFAAPYTFGVAPLQQMLVELPGGKLQAFTTAWDTEKRRWFSLYPGEKIPPDDALHWTGRYQRWNAMCADCHSTGVKKGYDAASDSYRTTWAELDVGCQACHGPGSAHVTWARAGGKIGEAAPAGDGLLIDLKSADARRQVESCAPCHARRAQIRAEIPYGRPFLDGFVPATLDAGLYQADGQIDGEVYEYGSFLQSKMYAKGVRCSDCHDSHSGRLEAEGNALCVRCHSAQPDARFPSLKAKLYDTPEHSHHAAGSTGAACVGCHMPTKSYMRVDPRQDHSIRVPRPDLSLKLGTPNACNGCHSERKPEWAAQIAAKWYGPQRQKEPHFGEVFAAARAGDKSSIPALMELAVDPEVSTIVRATALGLLEPAGPAIVGVLQHVARDSDPWLRSAAASACDALPSEARLKVAEPLLSDPVLGVRIEAARVLSIVPGEQLPPGARDRFADGLREFEAAQRVSADLPGAHLNLGVVFANRGDDARAEAEYRIALRMDPAFLPASFNLATLLNKMGRNADAESVLREAIAHTPGIGDLHYSLGLLLAEVGRHEQAAEQLGLAAALMPERARVQYNHGLALLRAGKQAEAEVPLRAAYQLAKSDPQIVHALTLYYTQVGNWQQALPLARELVALAPEDPGAREMLERVEAELSAP